MVKISYTIHTNDNIPLNFETNKIFPELAGRGICFKYKNKESSPHRSGWLGNWEKRCK